MLTLMGNLLNDLIGTIDRKANDHLRMMQKYGELTVKVKPVSSIPGYFIVPEQCQHALVGAVLDNCCKLCMKEQDEMIKCELCRAMIDVMPPDSLESSYGCPYRFVKLQDINEED